MEDCYKAFGLLNIHPSKSVSMMNGEYQSEYDKAYNAMVSLGFMKVNSHCVYKGPVQTLITGLKLMGWKNVENHPNPYLLEHPDCRMMFNYALTSESPDDQYVAFFRG